MEKIENIIDRNKKLKEVNLMKPLVWAYIGDNVYELFIRMHLVNTTNLDPHRLHVEAIKYVSAKAQKQILFKIQDVLSEEEKDIVRRGRNADPHHSPKNIDIVDYKYATGFEALIGYLYLSYQDERLKEILNMCI